MATRGLWGIGYRDIWLQALNVEIFRKLEAELSERVIHRLTRQATIDEVFRCYAPTEEVEDQLFDSIELAHGHYTLLIPVRRHLCRIPQKDSLVRPGLT